MEPKKHRRKVNRTIIFMSDSVEGKVRQIHIKPWVFSLWLGIGSILIGIVVGCAVYESSRLSEMGDKTTIRKMVLEEIKEENKKLRAENDTLTNKVAILSETVNQKVQDEKEFVAQQEADSLPTQFPLTGSATVQEITEDTEYVQQEGEEGTPTAVEPICIFSAAEGTTVVAAGSGIVTSVEEDSEYGHRITVDHGNGYVTIYRNKGDVKVKVGDAVSRGVTLYIIASDNTELGYQMMHENQLINPMDMIAISG